MNIFCKILGHKLIFNSGGIKGSLRCVRKGCNYTKPKLEWGSPPPMPICKDPKPVGPLNEYEETLKILETLREKALKWQFKRKLTMRINDKAAKRVTPNPLPRYDNVLK